MRISLTWLQDFIEFKEPFGNAQGVKDPQKIADAITAHTAEVDEVEVLGGMLEHCCVGKVLKLDKHPNADRLTLCDVQTDKGKKRIVCGGTNLREGMRVAVAHVGATVLWHGTDMVTLEPVKIRGEASEGMICAAEELGLEKQFPEAVDTNIVDFGDGDEGVGQSLKEFLGLDDVVLHVDNHSITHRPDLFSQIGFARECVAMGIAKWKSGSVPLHRDTKIEFGKEALPIKIKNSNKELVPRYACCVLEIDDLGETPDWMKTRLAAADWRSINVPVDITNFVSSEVGMPLHSFDLDDIEGDIEMRAAKKGEKITTLDEEARELPEGALVMSDKKGIFDLLGVMGGLRSSTKPNTRRIFLHSAAVDPVSIRRTIIATGHRTEAATVYEKGIAPVVVEQGFYRALELFLELVPGAKIVSVMESWGDDGEAPTIEVSADRVRKLIGADVATKEMIRILEDLECTVKASGEMLSVTPPLHRLRDLKAAHDIVEEIARMYGYNTVEPIMPMANITPPVRDTRTKELRRGLQLRGYNETLPLSILGPELLKKCMLDPKDAAAIENPIGEELSLMQPSTLPRLLEQAGENITRVADAVRMFHIGSVFNSEADKAVELGIVYAARKSTNLKNDPFLQLKQDLCASLEGVGYECKVQSAKKPASYMHPGRAAELVVDGKVIGEIFEVLPGVRSKFDLPERTAAVLLNMSMLLEIPAQVTVATALPQFPAVVYDETLPMNHGTQVGVLLEKARKVSSLVESIVVADLFDKQSEYNLTLRFTYRAADRTLKEEEAKKAHSEVMAVLQK